MVAKQRTTVEAEADNTIAVRPLDETALRDIADFESAARILAETVGVTVVNASEEIGDGFAYVDNKDVLIGRPTLFVKWECALSGSFTRDGSPIRCVNVWAMYQDNGATKKVRFTDFSTGVCAQLWAYYERDGRDAGLALPRGLRKSEFMYTDPKTQDQSMTATHYIDLAPA